MMLLDGLTWSIVSAPSETFLTTVALWTGSTSRSRSRGGLRPSTSIKRAFFSVILLALVDAEYRFMWADLGAPGHCSDAQIFNRSDLHDCLEAGVLGLSDPDNLPGDDQPFPYYMVGDNTFALRPYIFFPFFV